MGNSHHPMTPSFHVNNIKIDIPLAACTPLVNAKNFVSLELMPILKICLSLYLAYNFCFLCVRAHTLRWVDEDNCEIIYKEQVSKSEIQACVYF